MACPLVLQATEGKSGASLPCFVRLADPDVDPASLGIPYGTCAGGYVTTDLAPDQILELAARPQVASIALSVPAEPFLDVSLPETKAHQVQGSNGANPPTYSGYAGNGVFVGIVDSGIDIHHPDFYTPSGQPRIQWVWDQTDNSGSPPSGFSYGSYWTAYDIMAENCTEADHDGHGTHVAGTAAGSGAATANGWPAYRYVGVAPQADIIAVKTDFQTSHIVDAVSFIMNQVGSSPVAVNLSLGSHFGPHDGTSAMAQMLNALVGKGKIIVAAAGNEAGDAIHAETLVDQGQVENIVFYVDSYNSNAGTLNDFFGFDCWYTGGAQFSFTIITPGGHVAGPVAYGQSSGFDTSDGYIYMDNSASNRGGEGGGDNFLYVEIYDKRLLYPPAVGPWTIEITGVVVPSSVESAVPAEFDAWVAFDGIGTVSFIQGDDEAEIVGIPATADSIIAVGAYVTKVQWPSVDGNTYGYNPAPTLGDIAPFSSIGPRRDGVLKPDIAAPGMGIMSAYSADASGIPDALVDPDEFHWLSQGTSMACPHVTGIVALMLQADPNRYTRHIKNWLQRTARHDSFTGSGPNPTWGYGKVDAYAAVTGPTPVVVSRLEATTDPAGIHLAWSLLPDAKPSSILVLRAPNNHPDPLRLLQQAQTIAQLDPNTSSFTDQQPGSWAYWIQAQLPDGSKALTGPTFASWPNNTNNPTLLNPAPNPFGPYTTIQLNLPRPEKVLLEILDPAGRRITTLANATLQAGSHRILWNGTDQHGQPVASGLYFARARVGDQTFKKRLILLK
jgi:subtilisin family serine protease